jgi:predicted alpha/beta-hydrolase family hydrolase
MRTEYVDTPVGPASIEWHRAADPPRVMVVLGHGTATGVEASDLQAIAAALPPLGITVALVTQPYRLARRRDQPGIRASDEPSLDAAWRAVWPQVAVAGVPMITGGRSAGSQVACRTAKELGAAAVIALAYPLLGPGSPRELLATGLPMLVVQGGLDPFGRPGQFPPLPAGTTLVEIPQNGHVFASPTAVAEAVTTWLARLPLPSPRDRSPEAT